MNPDEIQTADELWEYCLVEYDSNNPIVKFLISNFYKELASVIEQFGEKDKLLEVGCGAAASSLWIHKMLRGQSFEVSDYDPRYIEKLKKMELPFDIQQESVYELERENNSFDCIFLLEVLEHLDDPQKAISELFRVSRKHVVISVPNEPIWRISNMLRGKYLKDLGNTPGHINHYSEKSLKDLILPFGKIKQIFKPFPWLMILIEKNPQ